MTAKHQSIPIRDYYQQWYATKTPAPYDDFPLWHRYTAALQWTIEQLNTPSPRGLEVGSGGGQLQNMVEDYVGVDIAASAGRFVDAPFYAASATRLPFQDASFDIVWSIWTLEHVIDPEAMLSEMMRVTKKGGMIFLCASWMVPDWATRTYHLGPWREKTLPDILLKASVPGRKWFGWPFIWTTRLVQMMWRGRGEHLSYRFLLPNHITYEEYDADACIQIDTAAVIRWYRARGVACKSHPTEQAVVLSRHDDPLIFQL